MNETRSNKILRKVNYHCCIGNPIGGSHFCRMRRLWFLKRECDDRHHPAHEHGFAFCWIMGYLNPTNSMHGEQRIWFAFHSFACGWQCCGDVPRHHFGQREQCNAGCGRLFR